MKKRPPDKVLAFLHFCLVIFFLGGILTHAQQSIDVDPADQLIIPTPSVDEMGADAPGIVPEAPRRMDRIALGLGVGLDHGGLGASLLVHPQKYIGLFGGVGYNLNGAGVNGGIRLRYISDKGGLKITPFLTAMYGYNSTVIVLDADDLSKTYYGATFGGGIDFHPHSDAIGYWSFGLLIPLRGQEVLDYMSYLEDSYGADFGGGLLPFVITLSYRFMIR